MMGVQLGGKEEDKGVSQVDAGWTMDRNAFTAGLWCAKRAWPNMLFAKGEG